MTATRKCSCVHADQDQMYGDGIRLFNKTEQGWRCTVCLREIKE